MVATRKERSGPFGEQARADLIAAASGPDRLVTVATWLLIGYLVLGRAFAQIGLPGANVFLGEVIIVALLVIPSTRAVFVRSLEWLTRPGPFHVQTCAAVLFIGFGLLLVVGGFFAGHDPLQTLKNLAFNYYVVMMLAGLAIGVRDRELLPRLALLLPWLNAAYVLIFMLALRGVTVSLPFSAIEGLTPGAATVVSLALIVCYDPAPGRRWYLIAANVFCLLFLQVRGDWLAATLGLGIWATLRRRWRSILVIGAVGLGALLFVSVLDLSIPGAADRGGAVSAEEIFARAVAPIDPELAARYSDEVEGFAGTAEWRQRWWDDIWASVHTTDTRTLFGHGYGFPLHSVADFLAGEDTNIRTPHNVFFYALGFSGWLGVAIFATLHLTILAALIRVYREFGDVFGVVLWVMATSSALFGNFFETPYNSAPYWFMVGVVLSRLMPADDEAARRAQFSR
ncbi:MAG: O-antigen ligase family protein [Actinomycetota bacterium]